MGDELNALLKQLEEHAEAAEQADQVADTHRAAIRQLLPQARQAGAGPAELERAIHGIYVAGTISRWTKDVAGPRGGRKTAPGRAKRTS